MLILESPWTRQPQTGLKLNENLRGVTDVFVGSGFSRTVKGSSTTATNVTSAVSERGLVASIATGTGNRLVIAENQLQLVPNGQFATIALLRRHHDTTNRAAAVFGFDEGGGNRALLHAPFSDGNFYWDFGNATAGSGRLSGVFAKSTNWETIVCVAGPAKGRELWRNGTRIANNTSATASKSGASVTPFHIGAAGPTGIGDNEDVALFVACAAEWTDAEILRWSINPYGETFAPRRIHIPTATAAGYTHPTLSAATALEIGATSFKPSVTYTFA